MLSSVILSEFFSDKNKAASLVLIILLNQRIIMKKSYLHVIGTLLTISCNQNMQVMKMINPTKIPLNISSVNTEIYKAAAGPKMIV